MSQRFSNFTDLADHYAQEIATPDYAIAFMEQTELAKLSYADEPTSAEMPDPEVAQAAIEMMLATVFDLFRDTRMDDFAAEVAWGIANSFHVVAKRLDDREDSASSNRKPLASRAATTEVVQLPFKSIKGLTRKRRQKRNALMDEWYGSGGGIQQ